MQRLFCKPRTPVLILCFVFGFMVIAYKIRQPDAAGIRTNSNDMTSGSKDMAPDPQNIAPNLQAAQNESQIVTSSGLCSLGDVSVLVPGPQQCAEKLALDIHKKHGIVLVGVINQAYLPFVHSWLCNTEHMNIHDKVLIGTTDVASQEILQRRWPAVKTVSLALSNLSGDMKYSQVGYLRVTVKRGALLDRIMQAGVRILLFEFDCAWLSNPLPTVLQQADKADIIATKVTGQTITASGFLLLNPTPATKKVISRFAENLEKLIHKFDNKKNEDVISESLLDQNLLDYLIRDRYAGVTVFHLPADLFPDGKWYNKTEEVRNKLPRPIIINNNWVIGNDVKISRAKLFGHWYVKDGPEWLCDEEAIKTITN